LWIPLLDGRFLDVETNPEEVINPGDVKKIAFEGMPRKGIVLI
jgi:hypothetical protein